MVTSGSHRILPPWEAAHFIGGHPALDLANTVFHRAEPVADNELLKTVGDVTAWCRSVGLVLQEDAERLAERAGDDFVEAVRRVRENAWRVFSALAAGEAPPPKALGALLRSAGLASSAELVAFQDAQLGNLSGRWEEPEAVPAALALLALEALFILPKDRIRSCPRCGWLFVDRSKGGRRRWCSMITCGNREKARRHRHGEPSAATE